MSDLKIKTIKLEDFSGVVIMLPNGEMLDITRRGEAVDCDHRVSIQGDSLGNVTVDHGMLPAGIKNYIVWSPAMLENQGCNGDTYESMVICEIDSGCSFSSIVRTDDIEGFVNAVLNEFNGSMEYHYLPD